ncbi:MAG: HAMP domain-containing histidine kinase [Frankiaceae bacterium]|nr:HAMP domain-containing histidine kinase [Frankiaceae bacterium]
MNPRRPLDEAQAALARTPLRVKLVGAILLLTTAGLVVAGAATTAALHSYLLGRVDDQLRSFAHDAGDHNFTGRVVGAGPGFGGAPGPVGIGGPPSESADTEPRPPSQIFIEQYQPDGHRDGIYNLTYETSPPALPPMTTAAATRLSGHAVSVPSQDHRTSWRVMTIVRSDGSSVVVASSLSDVNHTTHRVILLEVAIGLAAIVLIGFAGNVVISRSLRPLVRVETTAAAIADGDLTQRVPDLPERTEVGRLSAALNTMLAQIETAFAHERESQERATASEARMRQFVADASHELRTPLTSIQGFAELFRMGAAAAPTDVPHLMSRIETEAARMGLLVEDLLLLARLDQQRPLERAPVDLLAITTDVVHDAQVVAADRAICFTTQTDRAPVTIGDEPRLRQVLHNLMSNAITHTPAGSPIDVAIRTTVAAADVTIEIADRGPGIPAEHADLVFERFFREDASRSRAAGGAGLGLSIVSGLVAAHSGTVEVRDRPGGGAVFSVRLPLAEDAPRST